jgi:hypothetical protein
MLNSTGDGKSLSHLGPAMDPKKPQVSPRLRGFFISAASGPDQFPRLRMTARAAEVRVPELLHRLLRKTYWQERGRTTERTTGWVALKTASGRASSVERSLPQSPSDPLPSAPCGLAASPSGNHLARVSRLARASSTAKGKPAIEV